MKKILGVIPARIESQRLPAKPLIDLGGKTVIQRVWEQATKAKGISEIVISSNSEEILKVAQGFGAKVILTSSACRTGTDRVAETCKLLGGNYDLILNIQGDMPFINPDLISYCLDQLEKDPRNFDMATPAYPIFDEDSFNKPNIVKVVLTSDDYAMYFSRSPVPFLRLKKPSPLSFKHIGLYIYKPEALLTFSQMESGFYEQIEGLEQLRLLEKGLKIRVIKVDEALCQPGIEIDTPEDVTKALQFIRQTSL